MNVEKYQDYKKESRKRTRDETELNLLKDIQKKTNFNHEVFQYFTEVCPGRDDPIKENPTDLDVETNSDRDMEKLQKIDCGCWSQHKSLENEEKEKTRGTKFKENIL